MTHPPILYSFRRCPYAMRARMALWVAGITVILREVKLSDKPEALVEISPKATVPVLVPPDGPILEESLAIMHWALGQNDPEGWLKGDNPELILRNDGAFKHHLDRYKYPSRYEDEDGDVNHRAEGLEILTDLDARIAKNGQLSGDTRSLADMATFPFIRQFANTDRAWFDSQDLPHLKKWLEGHLNSEIFSSIMPKFDPWKPGDKRINFGP